MLIINHGHRIFSHILMIINFDQMIIIWLKLNIYTLINLLIFIAFPTIILPLLSADCCILFTMAWVNGRYSSSTVLHLPHPIATCPLIPVDCHVWSLSWWYQFIVTFFNLAHGLLPSSQVALVYFFFMDYCYRENKERWHEQRWGEFTNY